MDVKDYEEMRRIFEDLREVAKNLGVPIVTAVQPHRGYSEQTPEPWPQVFLVDYVDMLR